MLITHANTAPVNAISKEELEAYNLNIMRYRTAIALVESLYKRGEISERSYKYAKHIIARHHCIKENSIYR